MQLIFLAVTSIVFFVKAQAPLDTSHYVPVEKNLTTQWTTSMIYEGRSDFDRLSLTFYSQKR